MDRTYEAPETIVVDVAFEGEICQSVRGVSAARSGYGAAIEEDWG